jgi:hypothetical protein
LFILQASHPQLSETLKGRVRPEGSDGSLLSLVEGGIS